MYESVTKHLSPEEQSIIQNAVNQADALEAQAAQAQASLDAQVVQAQAMLQAQMQQQQQTNSPTTQANGHPGVTSPTGPTTMQ
jgi:uncharacterized protein YgiM (DUF1202 family)